MRYHGIKDGYEYINNDTEFNFSDVLTLIQKIRENNIILENNPHNTLYSGRNIYYTQLGESILHWIAPQFKVQDFLYRRFDIELEKEHGYSLVFEGLTMLREKYLSLVFCFSRDWVWDRWKYSRELSNHDLVRTEVVYYKESLDIYKKHIENIDIILSDNLWINLWKYVTLKELREQYWFNLDIEKFQDEYFPA